MKIFLNKPAYWIIVLAFLPGVSPVIAQKPAIDWAFIPAGTFTMGSPRNEVGRTKDEIQHQVTLIAFKMSKQEVTVKQFKTFVDATGYKTDAEKGTGGRKGSSVWKYGEEMFTKKWLLVGQDDANWRYDIYGKIRPESEYNHPVIHVSWNDAKAFADCIAWDEHCRSAYRCRNVPDLRNAQLGFRLVQDTK